MRLALWTADGRRFEEEIPGDPRKGTPMNRFRVVHAADVPPSREERRESPGPWPRMIRFSIKRYCKATGCVVYEETP